jgi:hypothetical protein
VKVDPVALDVILGIAGLFAFLCAAAGTSVWRDHRGVGGLQRWAARNGWLFAPGGPGGPRWAGWSPEMIASEVSRLQPRADLQVQEVGPVLTGVVDGTQVSLARIRWRHGIGPEGGTTSPYTASHFVAVQVPEGLPPITVRRRPRSAEPTVGGLFGARFLVAPEEARADIPGALQYAHLAGEVSPWTRHDGRVVSICRHQLYDSVPRPGQLLPAARRGLRAARLRTESEPPARVAR